MGCPVRIKQNTLCCLPLPHPLPDPHTLCCLLLPHPLPDPHTQCCLPPPHHTPCRTHRLSGVSVSSGPALSTSLLPHTVHARARRLTRGTTTWRSKCDSLASEQAALDGLQASLQELSEQDHEAKVGERTRKCVDLEGRRVCACA